MPDQILENTKSSGPRSPICIHTRQVTDSCLDKDCIEQLRVYLTVSSQAAVDSATAVKLRCAELLFAQADPQPLGYKPGWYAVDCTFYYRISGDAVTGSLRPTAIVGIAVFSKRAVLYGGQSKAKVYHSTDAPVTAEALLRCDLPVAVLEVLDPMVLASRVKELCECKRCETELAEIPEVIAGSLGEELVMAGEGKRLYVTVGQFSTLRLERSTQISVAVCDYCAPSRSCCDEECCEEDPCELFSQIDFPMQAFFPNGRNAESCTEGGCRCEG